MAALAAENAGTPRIRHSVLGIHSQFRNRFWTPFTIELENLGSEWRGAIVVEVRSEFSQQLVYLTRPVCMPAHSFGRFDFPLLPDFFITLLSGDAAIQMALTLNLADVG